ncbi:fimbrial protein [Burkholderia stagnalis]|uniref:fimbrial protein n=1 Tax=Burkholderia stagnalis TaxID=1503054 RepID=UPI000A6558B4|nr:fimbrial protein [Burkholderia stagnalis]
MKRFGYACLFTAVFVIPNWAWGQCSMKEGPLPTVYEFPSFETDVFDPNVPDGTVIAQRYMVEGSAVGPVGKITCRPDLGGGIYNRGTTAVVGAAPGGGYLYATGISGVGIRFRIIDFWTGKPVITYFPWNNRRNPGLTETFQPPVWHLNIELVKIGPITAGGRITGVVGGAYTLPDRSAHVASFRFSGGGIEIRPQVPTCRVTTPQITVPLGNIPASTFNGVGTVSPGKPFNIVLQCSGGGTGAVTNVHTTLTDHTNPGNVSDTLSLAQDSGATGIGIQVLNGSTVIKYGPDSSATGNTNQWKAGEAGNGTFTIPLTARYIQTAPKITPGTADGLATFTMSYQ